MAGNLPLPHEDSILNKFRICKERHSDERIIPFVNFCYLNRPYQSTTHRSGDLFINAAIMQLVTHEIDITIEQSSFGQKVGQCSSGKV